jgi:oxygen-independent coproporphyrinogen-3 oxidase
MAGIYVHIPFCKKICSYCDFYKILAPEDKKPLIEAVIRELNTRADYLGAEKIGTIYLGGGTPSVLSVKETDSIISAIYKKFRVEENCEITSELNPDDIDSSYMNGLKSAGINRISLGIQSWRDPDLKMLNRRHDSARASKALTDTFNAGFNNVTIDLIYGLPGMTTSDWEANLDRSLEYEIKHLSAYHLTVEPSTAFWKMKEQGLIEEPDEEESNSQFSLLIDKMDAAGFIHYEISNFGREGYFSRHNTSYWQQVNYLGIGPSAHSFNGYSRQWNVKNVEEYISAVNSGSIFYEKEELDIRTRFNEYIMTSLRTMWGIDLEYVENSFEKEGYDYILNLSGKFRQYGLMKLDKKNLVLTDQGKMISDNIISEFMMAGNE